MSSVASGLRVALVILALTIPTASNSASDSRNAYEFMVDISAEIMQLSTIEDSVAARENGLRLLLRRTLDFNLMSRMAAGRYWQRSTPEQRQKYQKAYADYVVEIYVKRLGKKAVESIDIISANEISPGEFLVTEIIKRAGHTPLKLGFRVVERSGEYKITDVTTESISLVLSQRTDFSALLRKNDFEFLIEALRKKLSKNRN